MNTATHRTTAYHDRIREHLARAGHIGVDPRHIEAWMRSERGTLDALSPVAFRDEVLIAAECVTQSPTTLSETLARSYGL